MKYLMVLNQNDHRQKLLEEGYCVFESVFLPEELSRIKEVSLKALSELPPAHRERNKSQGSLILIADYPEFSDLIAHPALFKVFHDLGFADTRFSSGYIISKPLQSPALFWHQDWWGWGDPISYTDQIAQVFVMIYLQDTAKNNGCLRVLPGSHRKIHGLHENEKAHTEGVSRVENPDDPLYQSVEGEKEVSVNFGDVVIGDARLIHGAYPNQSDQERTLITLWYHPDYSQLPEPMQTRIHEIFVRKGVDTDPDGLESMTLLQWPEKQRISVESFFPSCPENVIAEPWNRKPILENINT